MQERSNLSDGFKYWSNNSNRIDIVSLSKKLGFSTLEVLGALEEAGFDTTEIHFRGVNEIHLEVLSEYFVKAIKAFYRKVKKNSFGYSSKRIQDLNKFFSNFEKEKDCDKEVENEIYARLYEIIKSRLLLDGKDLDNQKIKEFFFSLIYEGKSIGFKLSCYEKEELLEYFDLSETSLVEVFSVVKNQLRLKLRKIENFFNNIKVTFLTYIKCSRYYIFCDDEADISKSFGIIKLL